MFIQVHIIMSYMIQDAAVSMVSGCIYEAYISYSVPARM